MFNKYPYTDFHELNTDWIIGKIKNVETAEANTKQYSEDAEAAKDIAVQAKDDAVDAKDAAAISETNAHNSELNAAAIVANTNDQINLLQSRVDNIIPDGTQTAGNTELLDIRVGADGNIYDSAGNAVRGQVADNASGLDEYAHVFTDENIGFTVINAYMDIGGVHSAANARVIYTHCIKGLRYVLTKDAGTRFAVAFASAIPTNGTTVTNYTASHTAGTMTVTAPYDGYLVSFVWLQSSDTETAEDMIASCSILGTVVKLLGSASDIDTLTDNGTYHYRSGSAPANWPISFERTAGLYGVLKCTKLTNTVSLQIVTDYDNNLFLRRCQSGTWTEWIQYTKNGAAYGSPVNPLPAKILKRVGCIGDSYTAGYIKIDSDPYVDYPDYAWPHFMENMTGNVWTNFGVSGSSTKSWIQRGAYSKLSEVEAPGNKCQAYIIGLMINDSDPGSTQYVDVGTAADIGTNADSYYAYYYKLIQAINAVNPTAPIFCNTCPKTAARFTPYNAAVRDIVTYCQSNGLPVFLCDLAGSRYNNINFYKNPVFTSDLINGHYTGIGYEMMAECCVRVLSDVMIDNNADFQAIQEVPYDA